MTRRLFQRSIDASHYWTRSDRSGKHNRRHVQHDPTMAKHAQFSVQPQLLCVMSSVVAEDAGILDSATSLHVISPAEQTPKQISAEAVGDTADTERTKHSKPVSTTVRTEQPKPVSSSCLLPNQHPESDTPSSTCVSTSSVDQDDDGNDGYSSDGNLSVATFDGFEHGSANQALSEGCSWPSGDYVQSAESPKERKEDQFGSIESMVGTRSSKNKAIANKVITKVKDIFVPAIPKQMDECQEKWSEDVTTITLMNFTNDITQQMIIDDLNAKGFDDLYDFVYLPLNTRTNRNRGYAFINFITPDAAWNCKLCYDRGSDISETANTSRCLKVVPAVLQGYEANCEARRAAVEKVMTNLLAPSRASNVTKWGKRQGKHASLEESATASNTNNTGHCQQCGGVARPYYKFCRFCGSSFKRCSNNA